MSRPRRFASARGPSSTRRGNFARPTAPGPGRRGPQGRGVATPRRLAPGPGPRSRPRAEDAGGDPEGLPRGPRISDPRIPRRPLGGRSPLVARQGPARLGRSRGRAAPLGRDPAGTSPLARIADRDRPPNAGRPRQPAPQRRSGPGPQALRGGPDLPDDLARGRATSAEKDEINLLLARLELTPGVGHAEEALRLAEAVEATAGRGRGPREGRAAPPGRPGRAQPIRRGREDRPRRGAEGLALRVHRDGPAARSRHLRDRFRPPDAADRPHHPRAHGPSPRATRSD